MIIDRMHHLVHKPNKWTKTDKVNVGDLCIFVHNDSTVLKNNQWRLGKVVKVCDRKIEIAVSRNTNHAKAFKEKIFVRSPRQVSIICEAGDLDLNFRKFLKVCMPNSSPIIP